VIEMMEVESWDEKGEKEERNGGVGKLPDWAK
jgi:hypothetical protein